MVGFDEDHGGELELYHTGITQSHGVNKDGTPSVLGSIKTTSRFASLGWSSFSSSSNSSGSKYPMGLLAGGLVDGTVCLWNPSTILRKQQQQQQQQHGPLKQDEALVAKLVHLHASTAVSALQFSPIPETAHLLATAGLNGQVKIINLEHPEHPTFTSPDSSEGLVVTTQVAFNTQVSHILASSYGNGTVTIWDVRQKKPWCELRCDANMTPIADMVWNPTQGLHLITASADDRYPALKLWDLPTTQKRMRRQLLLSLNFTRSNPPRLFTLQQLYTGEHPPMYAVAIRHLSSAAQKAKAYSPSHAKNKPTKKAEVSPTPSTQSSSKNKQPLCNEDLIRFILSQKPSSTVDTVQIRLVLDASLLQQAPLTNSNNNNISQTPSPATVQVISLSTAIQLASQYEVDLLAINMEQDPPVIKAVNVQKLLYKESKTSTGSSSSNAGSSSNQQKAVKEFQFKTCIGDHDLHRKVENMIAYLKKGHACQVMIQLNKRFAKKNTENTNTVGEGSEGGLDAQGQVIVVESPAARQNRFILEEMINKLRLLIGTTGQTQGNPKLNEERTRCSLYYQPVSKR